MNIERAILSRCSDPAFREWMADLLVELCAVDTTPTDIATMARRESEVFDIITRELSACSLPGARCVRVPISPAIDTHPGFTQLHHTKTRDRPDGLTVDDAFAGRSNLLFLADGDDAPGCGTALNAHVDVVAPFVPPHRERDRIHGRGAVDDKGGIVAILAAIRLVDELVQSGAIELRNQLTAMFVIEEETGGNGSLSLVMDRELRSRYDSLAIFDTASNRICPANRGAFWFAATIRGNDPTEGSPLLAATWAILEMQREGDAIKAESDHPLFPHRPVQTCNGILGPFGEHPSRICGEVVCRIGTGGDPVRDAEVNVAIARGVAKYIEVYGDRTKELDSGTGRTKVAKHIDISRDDNSLKMTVHGSTGHMGSLAENDAAITKWAYIVREVVLEELQRGRCPNVSLPDWDARSITLEGGQGFLPTHEMDDVKGRITAAFRRGIEEYATLIGQDESVFDADITYEKLNNQAFECPTDSRTIRNFIAAAHAVGTETELLGFDVSCDARLFAHEYPDLNIVTTGPGELRRAHSDDEYVDIDELQDAAALGAIFLMRETGTIPEDEEN